MRVLVTAGSRHGATFEIAEALGRALREHGVGADVRRAEEVRNFDGYDAAVIGSAVYIGHWVDAAHELVEQHREALKALPVWIFSSGPLGDPLKPDPEQAVDVDDVVELIAPREHRLFAGKIDTTQLRFRERAVVKVVRAPEGDYRDWSAIGDWAAKIARALAEGDSVLTPHAPAGRRVAPRHGR
jgi:menaquinone-dependent protoporphyrinogen oxidase